MKVIGCYRDEEGEIKEATDEIFQRFVNRFFEFSAPLYGFDISWSCEEKLEEE